ncbi:cytidylate kinase [Thermoplasma volcanium GSS1]|uniref:Cytidylate kinase n=1 Tax=Thermoplasma volcanium (strain ATCC 51530 / DSM 4299 / JCM 9571 / NBRC 15438 / GSS1) TaxID=273116 RepID=KCY_THEVO|nr:AAA family ATPase [Thermoplasma volcanium]Q97BV0.1 RecName: Full=Cytidylate kinase; Short=CK; AltName: Full=Cytidine monophosphate kinase; Short=CMP kinase [Thermoplasma volcanium GSS1]BAB59497.1 cytidylate kinase [Thermoplasma volcanium GSS1]
MRITIAGKIGSGKSTVSQEISKITGYSVYSSGTFFRESAKKMGMSIEDFNRYAETHPEADYATDGMQKDFMETHDNIIVEGRLAGWICKIYSISAFKVFLYATRYTRLVRFSNREGIEIDEAAKLLDEREISEKKRYLDLYGIDIDDLSIYDIVVNTEFMKPEEVAVLVLNRIDEMSRKEVYTPRILKGM